MSRRSKRSTPAVCVQVACAMAVFSAFVFAGKWAGDRWATLVPGDGGSRVTSTAGAVHRGTSPAPHAVTRGGVRKAVRPATPAPRAQTPSTTRTASVAAARTASVKKALKKPASRKRKPTPAVLYEKRIVGSLPVHIVHVDLRRPEVQLAVATAEHGIGYDDRWADLIDRVRPAAAITGTYFCTRSLVPIGSIVSGGREVHRAGIGTAFAYMPGRGARIITLSPGRSRNWSAYHTVVRAGPRLLTGGERTLFPEAEGFRDPGVYASKRRTGLALTRSGKLMLVASAKPVLLREFADVLKRLGARDAMCLDGGTSSALYHRGKTWVKPGRSLTNLLVVYDSPARFRNVAARLNPSAPALVKGPDTKVGG